MNVWVELTCKLGLPVGCKARFAGLQDVLEGGEGVLDV
jgi:hypothetical protein